MYKSQHPVNADLHFANYLSKHLVDFRKGDLSPKLLEKFSIIFVPSLARTFTYNFAKSDLKNEATLLVIEIYISVFFSTSKRNTKVNIEKSV